MPQMDLLQPAPGPDLLMARPVFVMHMHAELFTDDFKAYLPDNLHVFEAFAREAIRVHKRGFKHYSARTIIESLRHHSALEEAGGPWKLNDHNTPYLARLFDLLYPEHAGLWEFRETKAVKRTPQGAAA